ncbi:SDR family NAD(P)-dependent oxidoreductase [Mesorhizobium sp. CA8]|uniref:SDR family NAD(P)-dependent oxidoreductase n=1 Tax=unclassified Mesorhizobium TaxID=325217 RepID=UPI001CC9E2BF|nr:MULTISPECIES: SDR family NAD(P)-dependent oxidoreductase [unclassified Mesorhizobium]MBZ9761809.1 SDR family NAD(P)-dependent oxidoreductase [Mesorhizobium sp. CA8]MBZ9823566.1 SDR family NAD(P)-dependent oxidoreductase [Mesorhizobium sp. CA4]
MAIAKAALPDGNRVVGTVRNNPPDLERLGQFHAIKVDMQDVAAMEFAVQEAFSIAATIDVAVNNAGYGLLETVEESTDEELRSLFEVNVFAPIRVARLFLPHLRRQWLGHIVFITSIAGRAPSLGAALYSAAKHAVEGFASSLAAEVAPTGIKVTAVAPGQFRTEFLSAASVRKSRAADRGYAGTVGRTMAALGAVDRNQPGNPEKAAEVIVDLVKSASPPLHLLLGTDALSRARQKMSK